MYGLKMTRDATGSIINFIVQARSGSSASTGPSRWWHRCTLRRSSWFRAISPTIRGLRPLPPESHEDSSGDQHQD